MNGMVFVDIFKRIFLMVPTTSTSSLHYIKFFSRIFINNKTLNYTFILGIKLKVYVLSIFYLKWNCRVAQFSIFILHLTATFSRNIHHDHMRLLSKYNMNFFITTYADCICIIRIFYRIGLIIFSSRNFFNFIACIRFESKGNILVFIHYDCFIFLNISFYSITPYFTFTFPGHSNGKLHLFKRYFNDNV